MATRTASPGAALLRASRMFSVPAPLPAPSVLANSNVTFQSDTATLPYPTHLAITTPPSSLSRGDWGLKRSLPLRSTTRTSTPLIRVKAVDTYEHVTEFTSASDHALTLEKWQELNMPITTPPEKEFSAFFNTGRQMKMGQGVFEKDVDVTIRTHNAAVDELRWKFEGPWLAGQTDSEFNDYLVKEVRTRKSEFRQFLRLNKAQEDTRLMRRKAAEAGEEAAAEVTANDITDEQLQQHIRELRQRRGALFGLIRSFLDLPPLPKTRTGLDEDQMMALEGLDSRPGRTIDADATPQTSVNSPYAQGGPPKTHPSAGLSYLRTKNFVHNHPVYGPQANPTPVTGRIVAPKHSNGGATRLGIAGFITDVPTGDPAFNTRLGSSLPKQHRQARVSGLLLVDPDSQDGSKVELSPSQAYINAEGRVIVEVVSATESAKAVKSGNVDDLGIVHSRPTAPRISPIRKQFGNSTSGYGLGASFNGLGDRSREREAGRWDRGPQRERSPNQSYDDLQSILGGDSKSK